ncbi:DNA primase [Pseudoteredinibacter isoporae]|uniref:DNA primase n=1 Tax=Pseudoteredinibacter isoporae TaxID=570281 RepID=A0A7X0JTP9_9GAMM|nr:DNA primase [Pseudoteredinibacter isoporae]MBB6521151.1 DNA primase [Pseudoteredinibacter isoporae]NHO86711.1 DNA primase [Pseudoteredinibacter isoporae]NIB24837.1 DNA primase [Pseudoteredinibacter isoporae]
MSGRIPQSFLDDLLDRIDIVDVVDHRVKLKKTGKNYSACCPFHEEKTPSFTVSPDKQFYYCFGCGASGNALGFIMEYEHLDFPNAVDELAKLAGVEVPKEKQNTSPAQKAREKQRQEILSLLEKADSYYQLQLRQHNSKTQAVNYLKSRGLSGEICKRFGIGYVPAGWDNLKQELAKDPSTCKRLEEAGMLIHNQNKNSYYDRFRERIMFPIRDRRGRVIGFGGRVLGDEKPKYLNSPETPVFHKGEELYGLWEARQANSQIPRLLVVEGYMDVVALAQFDINYAVATLGTACGEAHLRLAFKHTQEIIFCFDGDNAGRNAAKRALSNSLPVMTDGLQIKFLFLEDGQDPDSYVRQFGKDKFLQRIEETASPLEDFLFDSLCEDIDASTMGGKAQLSKRAAPMLNLLPKGVYRELMFKHLAKRTELSLDTLLELIDQPLPALPNESKVPSDEVSAEEPQEAPSRDFPEQLPPDGDNPWQAYEALAEQQVEENIDGAYTGPIEGYNESSAPDSRGPRTSNVLTSNDIPPNRGTNQDNKLSPQKLLIGLLMSRPELAKELDDIELFSHFKDPDSQLLLRLGRCLQSRPHFNIHQLTGHWLASYGQQEWQKLKDIAEQSTSVLSAAMREGNFDDNAELKACEDKLLQQQQRESRQNKLKELKSKAFNELSTEEKTLFRQLIQQGH